MYRIRYVDGDKQISYENACDCQRDGILSTAWCRSPKLTDDEEKEIWAVAWYDCGDGCADTTPRPINEIVGQVWGFLNDNEKMRDFIRMSKEDFLRSYSYLTEYEYEATRNAYTGPYKVTPKRKVRH